MNLLTQLTVSDVTVVYNFLHLELFVCFVGTVISDEMGLTLEKAGKEVLGTATKVVITKDSTLIVTDGSTQPAVEKRVSQIRGLVEVRLTYYIMLFMHFHVLCSSTFHIAALVVK